MSERRGFLCEPDSSRMNRFLCMTPSSSPCQVLQRGKHLALLVLFAVISSTAFTGCSADPQSDNATLSSSGSRSLPGTVLAWDTGTSDDNGQLWAIDANNRSAVRFQLAPRAMNPELYNGTSIDFFPPQKLNTGELLYGVNNCVDFGIVDNSYCVDKVTAGSSIERLFVHRGQIHTRPAISPGGDFVALAWRPNVSSRSVYLGLYDRSGNAIE